MAKKKVEPTETPTTPEETPEEIVEPTETPSTDIDGLIAELEKAGVSRPEELKNKFVAAKEAGNLANQLGQTRAELAEIKALVAAQPKPQSRDYDYESDNTGLDLKDMMKQVIVEDRQEQSKQQAEVQQHVLGMWNEIQSDDDYSLVQPIWEEKLKDPNFLFQVQQGMANPVKEYNKVVRGYYKGIAKRSVDTIKTLQGKSGIQTPMHVEGGDRVQQLPPELSKGEERLKELQKKANKGTLSGDEEMEALTIQTQGLQWT